MAVVGIAGTRIRERRIDRGIRQADLAVTVGISPSYLNLIEHNRRRIAGKVLVDIARALDITPEQLTRGADAALLDRLRSAAAEMSLTVEIARAEEMAGRYPGWAALIAAQARRLATAEDRVQVLTDRMTYDPELAASLHEVITAVTAIRSAASILVGGEDLDADWQSRFHRNIYDDSIRLAQSSEALIGYLDSPKAEGTPHVAPMDEVEAVLSGHGFHFAAIEAQGAMAVDSIIAQAGIRAAASRTILQTHLSGYAQDAAVMPLAVFTKAAQTCRFDPVALSAQFGVPIAAVLRRLASLPAAQDYPPMGLAVADASGALLLVKPAAGFAMPRSGAGCPLWPVFAAFSRPGQPIRAEVSMPGANAQRFLCYAVAQPVGTAGFDLPQVLRATMLVISDQAAGAAPAIGVGVSCRICPREDCEARREPSVIL
ncbi:short-chain fatty acyl-CoA regulator family protein [Yoonia sp. MH D7]